MAPNPRPYVTLARWLGPWAPETARPDVRRAVVRVPGPRPFDAWWYTPPRGRPWGAYLIAPGLHYAGPADPRMDRFCAILAAAGIGVLAPFLPDYTALQVVPTALDDTRRAFDALVARPELPPGARPGVFSISFGSLLALRLAADAGYRDRVGGLVLFGGYADFASTIDFCLTGEIGGRAHGARDPTNQPVVFMNLLAQMDGAPADRDALFHHWWRYVHATWGRPEMKVDGRWLAVGRGLAGDVPAALREWFELGVGIRPGAIDRVRAALARLPGDDAFVDPRPHLHRIRCPVHLVHGVDDDVIPYPQSLELAARLPACTRARVHLTGLYGHTAQSGGAGGLRQLPALARELASMARILRAMIRVADVSSPA